MHRLCICCASVKPKVGCVRVSEIRPARFRRMDRYATGGELGAFNESFEAEEGEGDAVLGGADLADLLAAAQDGGTDFGSRAVEAHRHQPLFDEAAIFG